MNSVHAERVETTDVRTKAVLWGGVFFAGVAVIASFFVHWIYGDRIREQMTMAASYSIEWFPKPRLQKDPAAELRESRAEEHADANSYSWTDDSREKARIPIDRAMNISIEHRLIPSQPGADAHDL